jgi:hypothetical protein
MACILMVREFGKYIYIYIYIYIGNIWGYKLTVNIIKIQIAQIIKKKKKKSYIKFNLFFFFCKYMGWLIDTGATVNSWSREGVTMWNKPKKTWSVKWSSQTTKKNKKLIDSDGIYRSIDIHFYQSVIFIQCKSKFFLRLSQY